MLAVGAIQDRQDYLEGWASIGGSEAGRDLLMTMPEGPCQHGGSLIIGPDGRIIAKAGKEPEILLTELDLDEIAQGLSSLDTDGHYARPDYSNFG